MSTLKVMNSWWSRRAPILLGIALGFLAIMTVVLYIGQLQSRADAARQSSQISSLQYQSDSLSKALDDQRKAAKDGGAEVVVPPSDTIKRNPEVITGVPGRTGPQGEQGTDGLPGKDGVNGANGQKGDKGDPGEPGAPGASGTPGVAGVSGIQGAQGVQGDVGPVGPTGPAGPQGSPGPSGRDGTDGKDGEDGTSPSQIRIPIGAITYVCRPEESNPQFYSCAPEVGASKSKATWQSGGEDSGDSDGGPFQLQAAVLPWATDRRSALSRT